MSGVKIFTKAIIDSQPWRKDPSVIRKEWSEKEYQLAYHGGGNSPLCFAMMWDNGVVKPHPPLLRAMELTKKALEEAGHRGNNETIFVADGGEDYRTECARSGEPLIETMVPDVGGADPIVEKGFVNHLVGEAYHRTTYELWQLHKEKRELRKSHLDHWEKTVNRTETGRPVDAIISPAVAYPAVPHGLNTDSFYTTLCNAMDYTTSVFPVTFVDTELDHPREPHEFYNYEDEAVYKLYDSGLFQGCPIGLQLIGRTQEEEAVIRMTEIVDMALKEYQRKAK
ncbi:hypothetical protein PQX77_010779 [Marasmius sp. AFHP31]|nr:hypothetical protein PQX77_010779 [Marasmius sp. AFHP31]